MLPVKRCSHNVIDFALYNLSSLWRLTYQIKLEISSLQKCWTEVTTDCAISGFGGFWLPNSDGSEKCHFLLLLIECRHHCKNRLAACFSSKGLDCQSQRESRSLKTSLHAATRQHASGGPPVPLPWLYMNIPHCRKKEGPNFEFTKSRSGRLIQDPTAELPYEKEKDYKKP